MLFFPSESFILGMFIVSASLLFSYFTNDVDSDYFRRRANLARRLGYLVLIIAIALGISSSMMPIQ